MKKPKIDELVLRLQKVSEQPNRFIYPVTPEAVANFLGGFFEGIIMYENEHFRSKLAGAIITIQRRRGLGTSPVPKVDLFRALEIEEDDLIGNLFSIHVEALKLLAKTTTNTPRCKTTPRSNTL